MLRLAAYMSFGVIAESVGSRKFFASHTVANALIC